MIQNIARPRRLVLALYIASAAVVTLQQGILAHSNNLSIFRSASRNLFAGRDLYAAHPEQHVDFYKYSPTFALLFAPLAYLPFALAFLCWSLLNGLLLWYALDRLLPARPATIALALLYLEVLLALQYGQSNALVAALMILAFVAFEGRRQLGAALSITLGAVVKLFPLAALSVAAFYPRRLRFGAICIAVLAAAVALPLVTIPVTDLLAQYRSWHAIEAKDALLRGYSLMHYVHAWFGVDWPNWPQQAAGTALLLLPLALRAGHWERLEVRRLFLCSLLVYSVLFNHASESPSFVVAYAGIVIWYASSPPSRLRTAVMALTLLVMVVHDVDVVPRWVKYDILVPYRIKGLPCLVAWFVMQWELLVAPRSTPQTDPGSFPPPPSRAGA
jgi:Glycosyltransferase family 87